MENLYALFIKTGYEKKVVDYLLRELDENTFQPFFSKREKFFRTSGGDEIKEEVLFPGYVFVEANLESRDFILEISPTLKRCMYVHRVVNSDHGANCCNIEGMERERLLKFVGREGSERTVEISEGYIEGDKVVVVDGPLKGMESSIRKIDRHKRTAVIEIMMFGEVKEVKVGLEVVGRREEGRDEKFCVISCIKRS